MSLAETGFSTNRPALSRRAFLTATGSTLAGTAIAAAPLAMAKAAEPSDLPTLIEAHRRAYQAFIEAIDREQELEDAYEETHQEPVMVPCLLGGGWSITNGYERSKEHIASAFENQRKGLVHLSRIAPELAEQARAALDAKEAENLELVDRIFEEEEARKEAFGLAPAQRALEAAGEAELEAAFAICAYQCRTIEETQMKAEYLASAPRLRDGLQADEVEALLQSFLRTA